MRHSTKPNVIMTRLLYILRDLYTISFCFPLTLHIQNQFIFSNFSLHLVLLLLPSRFTLLLLKPLSIFSLSRGGKLSHHLILSLFFKARKCLFIHDDSLVIVSCLSYFASLLQFLFPLGLPFLFLSLALPFFRFLSCHLQQ